MAMDWLARWQSWMDPDKTPVGWERNLWGEFFALHHRRNMWHGFQHPHDASPEDAKQPAAGSGSECYETILRRRPSQSDGWPTGRAIGTPWPSGGSWTRSPRIPPSCWRVASPWRRPRTRTTCRKRLNGSRRSRPRWVAHLDSDHAAASQETQFDDFDRALDVASRLWQTWFPRVTGKGVAIHLPSEGWENVLRFRHRNLSLDNPAFVFGRVAYELGVDTANEVAQTPSRSPKRVASR